MEAKIILQLAVKKNTLRIKRILVVTHKLKNRIINNTWAYFKRKKY